MSEGRWPVGWPELVAPFPYFGGKRRAAPIIWRELGDPAGYVEPFAGSAAVLLARPAFKGRRVETINDADGWLVNTWRAIQLDPAGVARHAAGPVSEIDYHARLAWLQERRTDGVVSWLEGNPEAHDAKAAGWWLYVAACGIGDPWALATRLHRVRITCGSWERVVSPSVTRSGSGGDGGRAVLLDPPYSTSGDLYAATTSGVSTQVRDWCERADPALRIVLCGYDDEHDSLLEHGWRVTEGKAGRGAGYSARADNGRRERLWLSPACLGADHQDSLDFGGAA